MLASEIIRTDVDPDGAGVGLRNEAGVVAPVFWPEEAMHRIVSIPLILDFDHPVVRRHACSILELSSLADAIRAVETGDGLRLNRRVADEALSRSAAILREIAADLGGTQAEILRLRADGLIAGDTSAAAIRQAEAEEENIVLLCGGMSTWRRKSPGRFHGFIAALPWSVTGAALTDEATAQGGWLGEALNRPDLEIQPLPAFAVTDLIACGGEPNSFPKHFSYFLPEDEAVCRGRARKTLVFANIYRESHLRISARLAEIGLAGDSATVPALHDPLRILLAWFRGHDLGHHLRLASTDFRALRALGFERSITLQEALADAVGYLMVSAGPSARAVADDPAAASHVFLSEAMRYALRGEGNFPDTDAALLELSYLVRGRYVEISRDRRTLLWRHERLYAGMLALARELAAALLDTDVGRAGAMLADHLDRRPPEFEAWAAHAARASGDVPNALAYHNVLSEHATMP